MPGVILHFNSGSERANTNYNIIEVVIYYYFVHLFKSHPDLLYIISSSEFVNTLLHKIFCDMLISTWYLSQELVTQLSQGKRSCPGDGASLKMQN